MDDQATIISFNRNGQCNYCSAAVERLKAELYHDEVHLSSLVSRIKASSKGKQYDCVIGVSGGVDSSYVAYVLKKHFGLNPLAVHFDNGWNSELSVQNINSLLDSLSIDLITHVADWDEFKNLQLAFLKSSIANIEIPTDHSILALLYKYASKYGLKYIIHGGNLETESIMPSCWMHDAKDYRLLRAVSQKFSSSSLKTVPTMGYTSLLYNTFVKGIKYVGILNYLQYNKQQAMVTLKRELNWRPYQDKHFESIFTKFFQSYILPEKFKIDKRKAHLSSLIVSNQITRDEALNILAKPTYDSQTIEQDIRYFCSKLGLTHDEFLSIMQSQPVAASTYPNNFKYTNKLSSITRFIKKSATERN